MDDAMVRLSGEYVLAAHDAEILVSRRGGITLWQHILPMTGFTSYAEENSYARSLMRQCRVAGDGTLLLPVAAETQLLHRQQ
ncbi:hypothetical protein LL965_17600 [Xanthomonas cassavae CFBP 4642]|uniref:Uncharacterized protein n=1 Tax=Xanthomonas cassavae CFBP 4642 TaxID=1219375 RepID=A0ABS8HI41_9XANT|nr:hypothetical protein [Xanthomonas cassavae]MCC4621797.1 hypothetical protein [Xanthomonas cassavae CFBP 4642]